MPPPRSLMSLRTSTLAQLPSPVIVSQGSQFKLKVVPVNEGLDIYQWQGRFAQTFELSMLEDTQRLFFNYPLANGSSYRFQDARGSQGWLKEDGGSITYGPGSSGALRHQGELHSLTVAVRPEFFTDCAGPLDAGMHSAVARGQLWETGYASPALQLTTRALCTSLGMLPMADKAMAPHLRLKLMAQSLMMISLFLEHRLLRSAASAGRTASHQLLQARQALLENLCAPPDLEALAQRVDLSVARLNAGFKRAFGHTVYGLHQRERMCEARRLLRAETGMSVMAVAVHMGYSNASHFAAAFRKHFGINPAQARGSHDLALDP
jgi:AraC family transcriptional regulator